MNRNVGKMRRRRYRWLSPASAGGFLLPSSDVLAAHRDILLAQARACSLSLPFRLSSFIVTYFACSRSSVHCCSCDPFGRFNLWALSSISHHLSSLCSFLFLPLIFCASPFFPPSDLLCRESEAQGPRTRRHCRPSRHLDAVCLREARVRLRKLHHSLREEEGLLAPPAYHGKPRRDTCPQLRRGPGMS